MNLLISSAVTTDASRPIDSAQRAESTTGLSRFTT
jgi:hypothetical protein